MVDLPEDVLVQCLKAIDPLNGLVDWQPSLGYDGVTRDHIREIATILSRLADATPGAAPGEGVPAEGRFPRLVEDDPHWVEIALGHFVSAEGDRGQAALAEMERSDVARLAQPATASAARFMSPADERIGSWLSAALDDPKVCQSMKDDIIAWMDEKQPSPASGTNVDALRMAAEPFLRFQALCDEVDHLKRPSGERLLVARDRTSMREEVITAGSISRLVKALRTALGTSGREGK